MADAKTDAWTAPYLIKHQQFIIHHVWSRKRSIALTDGEYSVHTVYLYFAQVATALNRSSGIVIHETLGLEDHLSSVRTCSTLILIKYRISANVILCWFKRLRNWTVGRQSSPSLSKASRRWPGPIKYQYSNDENKSRRLITGSELWGASEAVASFESVR